MKLLLFYKDCYLFLGANERAVTAHQHPMIQLVLGLEGPFLWKNPATGNWEEKTGFIVPPNHRHACDACGRLILTIGLDAEARLGEHVLQHYLEPTAIWEPEAAFFDPVRADELNPLLEKQDWPAVRRHIERLFAYSSQAPFESDRDVRIQAVVDYIQVHLEHPIRTADLQQVALLSESRLLHLFKTQMGLPIRNYVHWCRIKKAFEHLAAGASLTETAYLTGFSDQAHLTRTFVKIMGLPPSEVRKNSKFVQVFFPT